MARSLPARLHLPSGLVVSLARGKQAPTPAALVAFVDRAADRQDREPGGSGARPPTSLTAALEALRTGDIVVSVDGQPLDPDRLDVRDFHVIRAVCTARGVLGEPELERPCLNCGVPLRARPSEHLELGPYLDGELGDPELDGAFPYGEPQEIPEVAVSRGEAREICLGPVEVGEAAALFRAAEARELRLTGAAVRGLGITHLGDETHPGRIARALSRCSDEAWAAIADLVNRAHYPGRLAGWVRCEPCGARNRFEAPAVREFPEDGGPVAATDEPFLDESAFAARVEHHATEIFARRMVRGVDLIVEDGVPACDEGGAPLLGSYDPPLSEDGWINRPPEVRVYYRTFAAMHREEGPYDVDAEIRETLEHELEHHLAYLAGYDPEDERERAEIADEERRLVGETEARRRATRRARRGLWEGIGRAWPLWLIAALVGAYEVWASR
jgi:hypothetical protein